VKKLHALIIKSYIGPFVLTFFIVLFIFLMQFLWKYIDDFVGKGLDLWIIAELMFYASANLVPMSLPLAVLLSSIMTMGNFAEQYELVAMKSSGLSLFRILQPLILLILVVALGAFYFNNNIAPVASLKFKSLLWDVTQKKPSLELKEGVFYNGIEGYSIRISRKDDNTGLLYDMLIYQYDLANPGNRRVIRARQGRMYKTGKSNTLTLHLTDGVSYDEVVSKNRDEFPHIKSTFSEDFILLDLSGFDLQRTDEDLWKSHMKMLSMAQLREAIDSLNSQKMKRIQDYNGYMRKSIAAKDSATYAAMGPLQPATLVPIDSLGLAEKRQIYNVAINLSRNAKNYVARTREELDGRREYIDKHKVEWHRKLVLSFACVVLFFIGAPLGAIIKKGGLGLPVIFSVFFFLIFHITSISGEKMVGTGALSPFMGMWLSTLVLFPIAIFLTWKAAKDAALFDADAWTRFGDRMAALLKRIN
jgi:lipopolysaccharide export system permease protein